MLTLLENATDLTLRALDDRSFRDGFLPGNFIVGPRTNSDMGPGVIVEHRGRTASVALASAK